MTTVLLKLRAQRPASSPAAAPPTRRRRLSPPVWPERAIVALAMLGYVTAFSLLLDVALKVF